MVRTFVSIPVPNVSDLAPLLRDLSEIRGIRTVSSVQLHITLAFIGEIDEERIDTVAECVSKETEGLGPARITLKGTGAFPNEKRPRVIWAGVETSLPLAKMSEGIARRLDAEGIPHDGKPFKPHITVARVQGQPNISVIMGKYRTSEFASFVCRNVMVMKSDLSPSGASYTILRTCDL